MNYKNIGEIVEVYDSLHKTPKTYVESGYPMVRVKDIEKGFLNLRGVAYVDEEVYKEFTKKYVPQIGDIILSRVGSYGIPCFVQTDDLFCLGQNTVILHPTDIYPRYLYYCLSSNIVQNQIEKLVTGSTQKTISLKSIKEIEVPFPSYDVQEKVGDFFFRIDNKLKTNENIINYLEEISQTIFKHWFLDFEFINEDGLPYKSSGGKMVESELGEIPEGWKVVTIGDVCVANQESLSKQDKWLYINYLDTGNITRNSIDNIQFIDVSKNKVPSRAKRKIQPNDIIYSTVRPNQQHYGIIKEPMENMVVSTGFVVLSSKGEYSNDLVYLWLIQDDIEEKLQAVAEQSTSAYPSIKPNDILSIKILLPNEKQLKELANIIESHNNWIWYSQQQNKKLIEIRDTLLPKLLSGEIEIPNESVVD